jgi:predicted MFS family arabinose efflux permease
MMSGIVKVGTGAGQVIVPLITTALIGWYGWRHTYLILGAFTLLTLVAVAQLLRRDPRAMGLCPDGANDRHPCGSDGIESEGITLKAAARTMQFRILCLAEFTIFFCLLTMIVHIVPHATDIGLPPATAAGVLATIGGVSMAGRIVMGSANDRIGGKRSLTICFALLLGGLIWLQMATAGWMLFVFAVIYGFAHGGFFTVMSPLVAELFGIGSHGLLFGMVLASGTLGGTIGPFLAGRIFDVTGSYHLLFLILTGLALAGLAMILLLRPLAAKSSLGAARLPETIS